MDQIGPTSYQKLTENEPKWTKLGPNMDNNGPTNYKKAKNVQKFDKIYHKWI